jgi:hypothetical protein
MHVLKWLLESRVVYCLCDGGTVEICVVIYTDSICAPFYGKADVDFVSHLLPHSSKHIRCNRCSCLQNASFQYVDVCWQSCYVHQIINASPKKKSYGVITEDIRGALCQRRVCLSVWTNPAV